MKMVRYGLAALRTLKEHGAATAPLRRAIEHHAAKGAHAKAVTPLADSRASRLRVGADRVIFEESDTDLVVTKFGRRGDVHD